MQSRQLMAWGCLLLCHCLMQGHCQRVGAIEEFVTRLEVEYERGYEPSSQVQHVADQIEMAISMSLITRSNAPLLLAFTNRMGINISDLTLPLPTARQATEDVTVTGTKSSFLLKFDTAAADQDTADGFKNVVKAAATKWADVWPGIENQATTPVVVNAVYTGLSQNTLGSAGGYTISGGCGGGTTLQDNSGWTTASLTAVSGDEYNTPDDIDIILNLNSARASDWYFGTTDADPAPADKLDMLSVALHEIGLFFSSNVAANAATGNAGYFRTEAGRGQRIPARYDQFIEVRSGSGANAANVGSLNSICKDNFAFGKAVTGRNSQSMRFVDVTSGADFGLHTPNTFSGGSSVAHFNTDFNEVLADCTSAGIQENECSELMTPSIGAGETHRNIGENTIRVMKACLSAVKNPNGKCTSNPFSDL